MHRSFPQLIRMLGDMDAVHGLYYVLSWPLVRLAGSGEVTLRLPSALAMAAAAGLLTALGRRLAGPAAGLAAGLSFAAVPAVSWFGQDARPFALETAIATTASYCFARFLDAAGGRWTRRYAVSLIGLGLASIFGLLLIAAHGTTLLIVRHHDGRQVARRWLAGRSRFLAAWPGRLTALSLPWLVVPPVLLIAGSQLQPVYTFRYIVFCQPAAALLIGAGLTALGRVAGPIALALIVLAGLPAQLGERGPDGHSDNIRAMDQIIARHARPGDAVLYPQGPGMTSFAAAYPYGLARLVNLTAGQPPAQAGTISGSNAPLPVVRHQLSRVGRVWVAEADAPLPGRRWCCAASRSSSATSGR